MRAKGCDAAYRAYLLTFQFSGQDRWGDLAAPSAPLYGMLAVHRAVSQGSFVDA